MAKERLHLAMPPGTKKLLDRLQTRIGASSATEVIRRSLAVMDFVSAETGDTDLHRVHPKLYLHRGASQIEVVFK